jgi:beta-lactamase superfamily II metal-dependent hydrolase
MLPGYPARLEKEPQGQLAGRLPYFGGMAAVIREFPSRFFLASGSSHTTAHYLRLLELVRERGIQAIQPTNRPRRIELGSVLLTVFPQAPEDPAEENNNSIGIRVQYGSFSALLPGYESNRNGAGGSGSSIFDPLP